MRSGATSTSDRQRCSASVQDRRRCRAGGEAVADRGVGESTITERNVNAMVARPGALSGNLLGQTFLDRLARYEVRGDKLILTGQP